jgi:aspartate kinase
MTADPRVIPGARPIRSISYDEAAELAYFGARVVHPSTILPAVRHEIPVYVKNTGTPEGAGTEIRGASEFAGVRAMASKAGITLITVQSSRMLNAYGFLRALFAVFEEHRISVDLVATSEVSVSLTVDRDFDTGQLVPQLEELGSVVIEPRQSIVCLVGRGVFQDAELLGAVFESLGSIPVRMISLGSSEINLSLVVPEEQMNDALLALHSRFFPT